MHSSFAVIALLLKSNIEEKCLINFLPNISSKALRDYLKYASIYDGVSPKRKTDLIEMIVFGQMTGILENKDLENDISIIEAKNILENDDISIKSLPGYGNIKKRKKDFKTYLNEKSLISTNELKN